MDSDSKHEWKQIAEQIMQEGDPAKITQLVERLCEELDRTGNGHRSRKVPSSVSDPHD